MTREELKTALRPVVNTEMTKAARDAKLVPLAKEWLASELARGNDDHEDIFDTWNWVMVELVKEREGTPEEQALKKGMVQ